MPFYYRSVSNRRTINSDIITKLRKYENYDMDE